VKQEVLDRLYEKGIVSHLDIDFADFMARLAGGDAPELRLAAALVSSHTREGNICLDLSCLEGRDLFDGEDGVSAVVCPELNHWRKVLKECSVVGKPGEYKPLVLEGGSRLYLFRYWDYQKKLAELIKRRVRGYEADIDIESLKEGLARFFPGEENGEMNWQKVAAVAAVFKRFCVISGGPGAGKTTAVARILALLLEQASGEQLRVALTAPTGKAAARLQEAIKQAKENLDCPDRVKREIPEEASTIHRLLGSILDSPYFRYNDRNPLRVDVLVVDEASMGDLALMSKLVQAMPPQARLILLGDRDQLASVEAGAVLGDICDTGNVHSFSKRFRGDLKKITGYEIEIQGNGEDESGIQDCIVQLQKSYRFSSDSGINAVSQAVNAGDADLAVTLLRSGRYGDIAWKEHLLSNHLSRAIKDAVIQGFEGYFRASDISEVFQRLDRFRVLCALREGRYGTVAMNSLVEKIFRGENLIGSGEMWYRGRPVLITRNDYNLQLFNGDLGIALPDAGANNELRAFFPTGDGAARKFHPFRLPEHETAYAMTVHRSQGSEFDNVLLLLPDRDSPVLTRELIYTGLTRARRGVEMWGPERVFRTAVSRRIERRSGLRDALWTP